MSDQAALESAIGRIEAIDRVLAAEGRAGDGGCCRSRVDIRNATLDDERAYLRATHELMETSEHEMDEALRGRLDLVKQDDPLRLANNRMWDTHLLHFGNAFNAVAEPIGRSVMTSTMAPFRLSKALIDYFAELASEDELILQERQALVHWQEFLKRNPDSP